MTELTIRGLGGRRDTARARRLSAAYRGSTAVGLCMACALTLHAVPARAGGALPTNGQYVAGQGSISSSGSQLSVNQTSSHGIINWQGFSIGQGNSVFFTPTDRERYPTLMLRARSIAHPPMALISEAWPD